MTETEVNIEKRIINAFKKTIKKWKNVSCEYDRWSTLQAAWSVRHAHWACLCYVPIETWCSWTTSTTWLLIISSTIFMVDRSRFFIIIPHGRYRSVTPFGVTRVNRTILQGRCCPQPFCARILYNPHGEKGKICMILLFHVKQKNNKNYQ